MAQVANKKNMTIAIREYTDNQNQTKKVWKTIGELTTWDDGSQSFELWGPTGSTQGQVFEKDNNQGQQQNNQQQGNWGQPQQPNNGQPYNQGHQQYQPNNNQPPQGYNQDF